jgi:hypothetical protein
VLLISLTVQKPKTSQFKERVFSAVHAALAAAGVPTTNQIHRVLEPEAENARFDPHYPDLTHTAMKQRCRPDRDSAFAGPKRESPKAYCSRRDRHLDRSGLRPRNQHDRFCGNHMENWSFGDGRLLYMEAWPTVSLGASTLFPGAALFAPPSFLWRHDFGDRLHDLLPA